MKRSIHIKGTELDLRRPMVMGILNVTPDSFSDGGKYDTVNTALTQAHKMINDGAGIIDVGGYSSKPGAADVSEQEELDRVVPIIEKLANTVDIPISIDTFRSKVAIAAVQAGACIVNDISAGDDDEDMIPSVAALGVPYIMMHKQGKSKTMQNNPQYLEVVQDVFDYLLAKKEECCAAGITNLIIDPGFGFGKTVEHNYTLLKRLKIFYSLGLPLMVGLSRKSMIYNFLGTDAHNALNGTTFLHSFALQNGANLLRVHDVKEAVECVKLFEKMRD
ncbi:MAG: dihydropteroate synthase [Bacteroidetes bacterium]|nr:dihydropteroate synthase [Bacteroidota bacterium]